MNYIEPEGNSNCRCRGDKVGQLFCGTGHLTECHYPFNCLQAACGHLDRYDPELAGRDTPQLEARAVSLARELAYDDCPDCGGEGLVTVMREVRMDGKVAEFFRQMRDDPGVDYLEVEEFRICGCVVENYGEIKAP